MFAILCFEVYHTKLHIWESPDTKMERQNTQISVNTTTEITEIVQEQPLDEIMGVNGVWILRKGLCEGTKTFQRVCM